MATISRPYISRPQNKGPWIRSAAQKILRRRFSDSDDLEDAISCERLRVICVSDTHNTTPDVPDGDILIHAGDLSQYGMFDEIQKQLDWLNSLPHRWKIVIAGNHDLLLDPDFVETHPDRELEKEGTQCSDLEWGNVIYLNNSVSDIEIPSVTSIHNRRLRIFGSPLTPRFGNFAFQYDPQKPENHDIWEKLGVTNDIDIFVTHGPPLGYLDDGGKGCALLLKTLWELRPRLMVFGHIHPGRGQHSLRFDSMEKCYRDIFLDHHPWLKLTIMFLWVLWIRITSAVFPKKPRHRDSESCQLVNAATVGNSRQGPCIKEPIVVYI